MLINPISLIVGMSGKLSKKEDVVFSVRYDNVHAWRSTAYRGPFTPDQTEVQADFAEASRQASADMADSVKKKPNGLPSPRHQKADGKPPAVLPSPPTTNKTSSNKHIYLCKR